MKVRIYTDGACSENPGPGGWGIVINTDKNCRTLSGREKNTTNNRMELTAVLRATRNIARRGIKENDYEIYSDSAYVVNAINQHWITDWMKNGWRTKNGGEVKNADLWMELVDNLATIKERGITLSLLKIKGHSGEIFNEMADQLAKQEVQKLKRKELCGE